MNQDGAPGRKSACLVLLTKGLKTQITKAPATSAMKTSRIIIKNCKKWVNWVRNICLHFMAVNRK